MSVKWRKWCVGSEYGTGSIGLVWGDNLGLGWIVFTGGVLTVEHSGHWPRRSWWFVGPVYRKKGGDQRSILPFHTARKTSRPNGQKRRYAEEQQDMTEIPIIEATSTTGTWTKTAGIGWEDTPDATTAAVAIFAAEAQTQGWNGGPASARP
ncbi:hypothetical protein B0H14DRAFT_3578199 [Mycena olivaceomarginata]|nr:hypothetical protein B0H14DRAFT_3578199 [Mycena olivaceomarginata]